MLEAAYAGSKNQNLATPWPVLRFIEQIIGRQFWLDVCAEPHTAKAPNYFTAEDDGLAADRIWAGLCWCNPPYKEIDAWVRKAASEMSAGRGQTVMLLPARTGLEWFLFCRRLERMGKATVAFYPKRIAFDGSGGAPYEYSAVIGLGDSFAGLTRLEERGAAAPGK